MQMRRSCTPRVFPAGISGLSPDPKISKISVKLVGTDTQLIIKEAQTLLDNEKAYELMSKASNPYGDGNACKKIISFLMDY